MDTRAASAKQVAGAGQSFDDGALTVVLSGATAADANPLTVANVGSIDFAATPGVAAVYVRARPMVLGVALILSGLAVTAINHVAAPWRRTS